MTIRALFLSIGLLVAAATSSVAAERLSYEPKAFQSALDAGGPVLVHITAPWCIECKAQKPVVAALAETPDFKNLTIVDVDFDTQKDALRALKVQTQSTLVVFKGKEEIARAVGITRPEAIEALMRRAL
ncbi:thioredoxin family protein [Bradyrhizobium sp.]|uniref:thioredoxin family protein n=1 Tax=Bradyrhizobium sp. TaxID=376 RepID=UPI001ED0FD5C|nr:thioredoxin family protein [Bradyrhizobium sp.]MBV8919560.1 thioredoxin family protein [Bradyrhizobium sp.]MBV9985168.1 thioredoxin family protein [Bradyrhizobium sp.]